MAYIAGQPLLMVSRQVWEGAAVAGQNAIAVPGGCTPGMSDVFVGGGCLSQGDFDDSDGAQIKLALPMSAGTQYRVVTYAPGQTVQPVGGQLAGFRNRIINGGMRIAQRATTFTGTPASYQTVDRFGCSMVAGGHTVAQVADAPMGFANSMKVTVGTGAVPAAADFNGLWHNIEGNNVDDMAYGTANAGVGTLSFYVKASMAGLYALSLMNNGLNRNYIATYTVNTPNTWERKAIVFTGDTAGTWVVDTGIGLSICWSLGVGSNYAVAAPNVWGAGQKYDLTAGTKQVVATSGATFQLTGVQFEPGAVMTPFEKRLQGIEQALCDRYLEAWGSGTGRANVAMGFLNNATTGYVFTRFRAVKRTTPALKFLAGVASDFRVLVAGGAQSCTSITGAEVDLFGASLTAQFATGMTMGAACLLQSNDGKFPVLGFDAEL